MTGLQRLESAFSPDGTPETGAVAPYEGIYIRDHWEQLTAHPWWYQQAPDVERCRCPRAHSGLGTTSSRAPLPFPRTAPSYIISA